MQGGFLEAGELCLPRVRLRVVAGTEVCGSQQSGEFLGRDAAVRRHQRQCVMERRPGLPREGEIGGDGDGVAFAEAMTRGLGRMQNIQVHHDGLGPFRLATVLSADEVIQRTNGAIHGNKGLDAGDARERVVPAITLETRLGGEQPERAFRSVLEPGKAEGAMKRLGLGRLGVGLHSRQREGERPSCRTQSRTGPSIGRPRPPGDSWCRDRLCFGGSTNGASTTLPGITVAGECSPTRTFVELERRLRARTYEGCPKG